jgi:hypothetical protein
MLGGIFLKALLDDRMPARRKDTLLEWGDDFRLPTRDGNPRKLSHCHETPENPPACGRSSGCRRQAGSLDAAATTRWLISTTKSKGISAYRLLGILASLDDMSLNASMAAVVLLTNVNRQDPRIPNEVVLLMNSKNASTDISELIFHATMRFVHVEEDLLDKLPK